MSTNNIITNFLQLKDPNLIFTENKIIKINNIDTICVYGTLENRPKTCYCCGSSHINIHSYKLSTIKLMPISGHNAVLKLNKQRYICKDCGKTFIAKTSIVDDNCCISNKLKQAAVIASKETVSEKHIAKELNISHSTVNREINKFRNSYKANFNYLPEVLCFDEFKSTKDADGAMSFIFCDAKEHRIIDIVENRQLRFLEKYFYRYTKAARNSVKFIVMDMYKPYVLLAKKMFPKAKIIFDKFHIINNLSRALDKARIKLMKNMDDKAYRKLKRYGKLLLKDRYELDGIHFKKRFCFDKAVSQTDVVDCLLSLDERLKNTYYAYQDILAVIKRKDVTRLNSLLEQKYTNISGYMKTALKTTKDNKEYVTNAVKYGYTNGLVEGFNNKIKAIKRVAFGYRSFYNFRNRILISCDLISIEKRCA